MKQNFKITTFDNPFSPFTQFDEWYQYDTIHGHNTLGLLSRMAMTSPQLSNIDQERIFESTMFDLIKIFPKTYRLVVEEDYKNK